MKREFLKSLGLTDDVINQIMAENGDDINKVRSEVTKLKAELAEAMTQLAATEAERDAAKKNSGTATELQKKLDELQKKYDTETQTLQAQLAGREYAEAVSKAIAGAGLKFSSKGAESAFRAALEAKKLTLKDGTLEGFEDFVETQKKADPESFASKKPNPQFSPTKPQGTTPTPDEPEAVKMARSLGKQKAESSHAAGDVFAMYAGGKPTNSQ